MVGKIVYISNTLAHIELESVSSNLMNMHIIFEDGNRKIIGEIEDIDGVKVTVHFLGEILNDRFLAGLIMKPSLNSKIRLITEEELKYLVGKDTENNLFLGYSPLYSNCPIYVDINELFSNHMAIFGNTGSGKSYGVARLLQNIFEKTKIVPFRSNFFIFDAYGEYHNAFSKLNAYNPNYHFKYYTTNLNDTDGSILRIPLWLLGIDDIALLLGADSHSQLPIIERMLKLVSIFSESDEQANRYKNHLIAKAIMTILYTNQTSTAKRNDIFSILASCSTNEFNLNSPVQGIGYVRKFRECFTIDKDGEFTESILVTEYISSFIHDEYDAYEPKKTNFYTLQDLEKALEFTLISEGLLRNDKMYNEAITLKVRLHSIAISQNATYFSYPSYVTLESYISSLVACQDGKAQIINFNLEDIDDSIAKVITKVYTRMLFDFTKKLKVRASIPFHIFLEEAHRYVQNDTDNYLIGYNIFERVAKEGRKYGLIFNLISQRPVEISETVISQCSNFMIFKMNHPRDLDYIKKMLPNINAEIVEKQKTLQPGTCVAFGKAFKVPLIIQMELPNPEPHSSNCDVFNRWK
ncbi:MAG: ATP-binding protein [Tenericutes bacterium]|nr:ATP-binding protein [Mycoplasmatota bacterium]